MKAKPAIKIIKRQERERRKESADAAAARAGASGATARDTVAAWVDEHRQRQRSPAKTAILNLFRDGARLPVEA